MQNGMLSELLTASGALLSESLDTSQALKNRAEQMDRNRAEAKRKIRHAVWNGESTGDVPTDIALALHGKRHAGVERSLRALQTRLAECQGQFIIQLYAGDEDHSWDTIAIGVVESNELQFIRKEPKIPYHSCNQLVQHVGELKLACRPVVLMKSDWCWAWKHLRPSESGVLVRFEYQADNSYRTLDLLEKKSPELILGDAPVWEFLAGGRVRQEAPLPIYASAIAEALGRSIGTIPCWKERSTEFRQALDVGIPRLEKLLLTASFAQEEIGRDTKAPVSGRAVEKLQALLNETETLDTMRHFVSEWEKS